LVYAGFDEENIRGRYMRVVLADAQAKVRSALRLLLEQEPGVEVLGEAVDATGLLERVKASCPDLVLLDWDLPGSPATALMTVLHSLCPRLQVIVLSGRPEVRQAALDAGADAFTSKGDPPERLLRAIDNAGRKGIQ
jgi:DNA-binding NarL/FixJ family response regulator